MRVQRCRRSPLGSQTALSSFFPLLPRSLQSAERSQQRKQVAQEQAANWGTGYGGMKHQGSKCTVCGDQGNAHDLSPPSLGLEKERGAARVPIPQMGVWNRATVGLCRSEQSSLTGCFNKISRSTRLITN